MRCPLSVGGHQVIESDEQRLVVTRVLRDGRRRYEPGSKARLVAACLEPGVSVSRLALDNGINANLLTKWIKEAKAADPERRAAPSAFVPVVAEDRSLSTDLAAMRSEMCLARSEGAGPLFSPVPSQPGWKARTDLGTGQTARSMNRHWPSQSPLGPRSKLRMNSR
ncbi:IS66-like element accessory protein TnpA [Solirhodobacter olei]|uniref:IS66-like element accessory protein TnpA n=1 Tax=Solirhodobacter olei TaxID=2493082 RepID=UPI000FD7166C